jgi:purine-nucleoside phosphorylase
VTPTEEADAAAAALAELASVDHHDVAVVLGSGWLPAVDELGPASVDIPIASLPGFSAPGVAGHSGRVRSLDVEGRRVLAFLGRTHLYEGAGVAAVAHPVRVAAASGCRIVVLTNACGGVRGDLVPGQPVLISDHINLSWQSPLLGVRFLDLTDVYSQRLRDLARTIDPTLAEGVYAMFPGPMYETPAEIRMVRNLGADLVGMSTVLEALAAREAGLEVLGISLVTNLAAGMTGEALDHAEVLAAGAAFAGRMGRLLRALLSRL